MRSRRLRLSSRAIEYLLVVLKRSRDKGYARQYELIEDLGISRPTASLMVKKLKQIGYLRVDGGKIRLSRVGMKLIRELVWKHGIIESALYELGLTREGACRIAWRIVQEIPVNDAERIWIKLGSPRSCPCGKQIPSIHEEVSVEEIETCMIFKSCQRSPRL